MLQQFSLITKTGELSYKIISTLVAALPLSTQERRVFSMILVISQAEQTNQPLRETLVASDSFSGSTSNNSDRTAAPSTETIEPVANPSTFTLGNCEFPQDPIFHATSLSDFNEMDFGELGQVWDWESLNLDLA